MSEFLNDEQINIDGGCILLSRAILDSRLWSVPDGTLKVAVYLLLKANHDKRYFKMVEIRRGQTCRSLNTIAEECFLSIKTVRVALKLLEKIEFIKIDKPFGAKQGQRISVCNYDTYQSLENHKGTRGAYEGAHEGARNNNYNNYNKYIFNVRELEFMNKYFSSEVNEALQTYANCFFETHHKTMIPDKYLITLKNLREIPEDLRVKSVEKSTGKYDDFYMPGVEFKKQSNETDELRPTIEELEK